MNDAFSEHFMKNHPTAVLNVSKDIPKSPYAADYLQIRVDDNPNENISIHFNEAINFINSALNRKLRVLVHCYAGISRSASIVVAYVMKNCNMPFEQAINYVRSKRNIINPNIGFVYQLYDYQ